MNQKIKDEAIVVFTQYPLAKKVFVTPDCQAFLKEDRARLHNADFVTVNRTEVMLAEQADKGDTVVKKTAAELIELMSTVATIEELDEFAKGEKRATVIAAIEARREELTAKQD